MKSSARTFAQSTPLKNSDFSVPKRPSARALSPQFPLRDIERITPLSSHIAFQLRDRWRDPPSVWTTVEPACGGSDASARRSDESHRAASGRRDVDQDTGSPSKQSITGDR